MKKEDRTKKIYELKEVFSEVVEKLGLDGNSPGLRETPYRIAKAYVEDLFIGLFTEPPTLTVFPNEENYDEIIATSFSDFSICEHHFLPFEIEVYIGYIPGEHLLGLSKFARLARWYARRPQVQERLTIQIADHIERALKPKGVIVVIKGEHLCERMRGAERPDAKMVTSVVRGVFAHNEASREEFLKIVGLR